MALNTLSALDLTLLSLHWVGIENDAVAVLRGDGELFPDCFAKKLVDTAWDKISRLCTNRGYKCAYLYAQGNGCKPKLYRVDAALATSSGVTKLNLLKQMRRRSPLHHPNSSSQFQSKN